jgi:hypothetical protein
MSDVSTSSPSVTHEDVSSMLKDHTKYMTNQLKYMPEDGLVSFLKKTLSASSYPYSVSGTPQTSISLAPPEPLENPLYGMLKGFTPSQAPPIMSALPTRLDIAMVMSPPIVEPLNSIQSSAITNRTNELANFVPPYRTVVHSIPPLPPMGTGILCGPVLDYYFNKYDTPDRIPRGESRRDLVSSFEDCLSVLREDSKKQMRETFGIELSNKSHVYQKRYPLYFDSVLYATGWRTPDFVKFNGEDNRTMWEYIRQYLAQLGEVGSVDALKVHLFSLSLTSIAFSWFSSLLPNSIDSWEQLA